MSDKAVFGLDELSNLIALTWVLGAGAVLLLDFLIPVAGEFGAFAAVLSSLIVLVGSLILAFVPWEMYATPVGDSA